MNARIFTICLFVLMASATSFAQKGGSISVGVTPGLSYMLAQNTYYLAENSKELDYKAKFSYHVFLQGGYNFKDQHGIVTYANYCHEGQNYQDQFNWKKYPALIGIHQKSVNFDYMGFGVLYRFAPLLAGQKQQIRTDNPKWRMKLLVGFEADFLLKAQMTYKIRPVGGQTTTVGYPIDPAIGGFPAYTPNPTNDYKSYFQTLQGVGVIKYGFDYVSAKNVYVGLALELKAGLNDINAKAYREHPDYKKSKNYFFGLNVEVGYVFKKDDKKEKVKKTEIPVAKTKTQGVDLNRKVDNVDKQTKKRLGVK